MALITVIAGAYTGVYTPAASPASGGGGPALAQGILADSGWTLSWTSHQQRIGNDGTDRYGETLLAAVHRGGDWRLSYRCREYATTNLNVTWPYGKVTAGSPGPLAPILTGIGREVTGSFAGSLVLTAVSGTPAASNPATLTAGSCAAAPGQNHSMEFTSRERQVPVVLDLFPYATTISATAYELWFVTT